MATQRTSVEQRQQPNIFFVIPCYNEIEQLPITAPVLQKKISALKSSHLIAEDSRVLFVDMDRKTAPGNILDNSTKPTLHCSTA